jgi:phospholipase C
MTAEQLLAGIDTFVILCMENRSFDHFLGARKLVEKRDGIDGLTGSESNPDPNGAPVAVHQLATYTPADPPHSWDASHAQWNLGANDGFVKAHAGADQADVMGYYTRDQVPITNALADQSAVCERWFAAVMGPTWPNRFYLHGATSKGQKSNLPVLGFTSIFSRLDAKGVSNVNYFHDVAWAVGGYAKLSGNAPIEQFFEHAMAGTLPQVCFIDPGFTGTGANDDHPAHDIRRGQALIASVVAALGKSPQWAKSLLVITYDEHGGFFDHVPPPTTVDDDAEFRQLGFRVPAMLIGPTVRVGCTIDAVFEHSSVAATLTKRFGLEPLNARATAAADLSPCIDPNRLANPAAPPTLPPVMMPRVIPPLPSSDAHSELLAVLDAHPVPRHLDRRADADAIGERVLAWGERLGVVQRY